MTTLLKRILYSLLPASAIDAVKVRAFYKIFDRYRNEDFPEYPVVAALIKPGDTVLDVGANIGAIAKVLWNLVGQTGAVHAFEPVPYTYKILVSNFKRAGAKNVTCHDAAISDSDGTATIVVPTYAQSPEVRDAHSGALGNPRNYYAAHLASTEDETTDKLSTTVPVRSLDSLFGSQTIHFIKCDAEGYELQCMMGARDILQRDHPPLFIELCSDPDEEGSGMWKLTEFLRTLGYAPYFFKNGLLTMRSRGMAATDLFFLTPEQHARVISYIAQ